MITNYLKIAWRNLIKKKGNSFIHIFGLTIGLTGCLLIGLFILDELKFDTQHPNVDHTYRIYTERLGTDDGAQWASTSPAFGPRLEADFPEVEKTLRIFRIRQKQLFTRNEISNLEEGGLFAESSIFDFFDLPLKYGDSETALKEINSIILTSSVAQKYYGDDNPVGQSISINNKERKITGVLHNLPDHFHLDFKFLVSFENLLADVSKERINSWVWQDFFNYIQLHPETDLINFKSKMTAYVEANAHPQTKEMGFHYYPNLQKLDDIYLHSAQLRNDFAIRGDYQYVWGLFIVGLFLLFIACINFINLTTARAIHRSKEVGIRKTTGASRKQLALQFIFEAIFIVAISSILAVQIANLILPYLNDFTDKSLAFNWLSNPWMTFAILGITLVTGLIAGSYPAFVLSGFRPVNAIKGISVQSSGHIQWLRKSLVTMQFALSIIMIISVMIIYQQVDLLRNKGLGFNKEQLVHFPMKNKLYSNFESTKNEFLKVTGVVSASTCFGIPGDIVSGDNVIVPGENRRTLPARIFTVDHEYVRTMGMEIISGRDFSKEFPTDDSLAFILNETAVKSFEIAENSQDAVGMDLEWEGWDKARTMKKGKIIGVVKDFHYNSLHEEVQPSVLHIYPDAYWKLALRLNTDDLPQTIADIEKTWNQYDTGYPIDYQFVDEGFGAMYKAEEKLNSLLWIFSCLAIIISCIGAFGLAAYAAESRRKEIGIRKVLGANIAGIVYLLTKDFIKLIIIASIIAIPIAWYSMDGWLQDFAYRIDIQWWVFVVAGLAMIAIAFATVSFQSIAAALTKPIESLRSE